MTITPHALKEKQMLRELKQLAYMYGLNGVIRFGLTRNEAHVTQSVAEHVTNILMCAYFFKDKVKNGGKLDMGLVARRALVHDMGEIEVGDVVTVRKNSDDSAKERVAIRVVAQKSPRAIGKTLVSDFMNTENGIDFEGRFVRAMDKFEGLFFQYVGEGISMIRIVTPDTRTRRAYIMSLDKKITELGFPEVARYVRVARNDLIRRGYLKNR